MTDAELMYASDEDVAFFLRVTEGLPKINGFSMDGKDSNGDPMPFGMGPHSVRCLREIVEIVKPKEMMEIGFCAGYSSAMFLALSDVRIASFDISNRQETIRGAEILQERYPKRLHLTVIDSASIVNHKGIWEWLSKISYDLILIDGGHLEHHVMADIDLALKLKIKYLAFDDIIHRFGPGVQPAIDKHPELKLVKEMGNIGLYLNTTVS